MLAVGTSKHGHIGPYPKALGEQALPSFAEGIFLPCAPKFSTYPTNPQKYHHNQNSHITCQHLKSYLPIRFKIQLMLHFFTLSDHTRFTWQYSMQKEKEKVGTVCHLMKGILVTRYKTTFKKKKKVYTRSRKGLGLKRFLEESCV